MYGWKPGLPDHRAKKFKLKTPIPVPPPSVDSLTAFIVAWDQGNLGSCTAHGTGRIWSHRYAVEKATQNPPIPSRLFIYYNERALDGTIGQDAGAAVSDGLNVLANLGAPLESDWPYDVSQFAIKPPDQAYTDALQEIALQYEAVNVDLTSIKQALAAGNPITMGFTVFESFEESWAVPGMMPMPNPSEQVLGGHCVCMDGYDDSKNAFHCMNSWGTGWGLSGGFWMPYANLTNCDDFWVLTAIK